MHLFWFLPLYLVENSMISVVFFFFCMQNQTTRLQWNILSNWTQNKKMKKKIVWLYLVCYSLYFLYIYSFINTIFHICHTCISSMYSMNALLDVCLCIFYRLVRCRSKKCYTHNFSFYSSSMDLSKLITL